MRWMLDVVREPREDGNIELGIVEEEVQDRHARMWEAWNSGKAPDGYDTFDNEFGKTYAWYFPLYVDGTKLGLIGTEVEITNYNHAILQNTLRQLGMIAFILAITTALTLLLIDRLYISKIRELSQAVNEYAKNKDASVVSGMEQASGDELSILANQTATMILELDNYMRSLLETSEELTHTRERVSIESELARKDALTGVRNRNAYEEALARLDEQLQEGQTQFGFAVVDVNFLKRINDTYGHDRGNAAIRRCSAIVCEVFAHSPVFRIVGDEFLAILQDRDYDNVASLVQDFERAIRGGDGEPWEHISAAIGYALYDAKRDSRARDVFNRADKEMYRRKRVMKGRLKRD